MLVALLFPTISIARGIDAIFRHAITGSSPVQQAKKAGALCEVVRAADWKPCSGDVVRRARLENHIHRKGLERATKLGLRIYYKKISIDGLKERQIFKQCNTFFGLSGRKLHGLCCLPPGYGLSVVSSTSTVANLDNRVDTEGSEEVEVSPNKLLVSELQSPSTFDISSSYSFSKGTIAILQVLYASATLYNTRGDQIDRYGFTAFGLTVAPYLVMSIVNLTGTILTPTYPTAFLVESEIMDEARRRGGYFRGAVGRLALPESAHQSFDAMFNVDNRGRMAITMIDSISGANDTLETDEELLAVPSNLDGSRAIVLPHIVVPNSIRAKPSLRDVLLVITGIFIGLIPFAINAGLSHLKTGRSTSRQQGWVILWMVSGTLGTLSVGIKYRAQFGTVQMIIIMAYCSVCAIGTFFTIAQMILEYGHCVQIYGGV